VSASSASAADETFPIRGYDTLRVSQILPLLDKLDLDELDVVREREEQGKGRSTLLRALDDRIDDLEGDDDLDDDAADDVVAGDPAVDDEDDEDDEDDIEVVAAPPGTDVFPIADYDGRTVAQILAVLDDLDNDELDMVAEREELGRNRAAILDAIDAMFDDEEPAPPPVKKAPAKKATAVRAAPLKKATPVKAAPVKKAPAAKVPVKKVVAAKKSAPAKRSSAPAKKAAPAVKRAPSVKKAPAKRATPTKRV